MKYAENTSVSSSQSRIEIEKTLEKYGATGFMYGWQGDNALIAFELNKRQIKFILPLPSRTDDRIVRTPERKTLRTKDQQTKAYEQAVRQKWRALSLCIKAKLEAVESGITEFDAEFMAHIVMPDGMTAGHHVLPVMRESIESGNLMPLLPDWS